MSRTNNRPESLDRIENARQGLIGRGYRCLSSGRFGLPSYSDVEAWGKAGVVLYFLFDRETGGWDILSTLDPTNNIAATWAAVDLIDFKGAKS
jgi:hypothetical protein